MFSFFLSSISSTSIGRMDLAKEESQSQTSSQKLQAEDGSEQMMKPCGTPREVECKLVKRKQQVDVPDLHIKLFATGVVNTDQNSDREPHYH